jgi:hypothetical protein
MANNTVKSPITPGDIEELRKYELSCLVNIDTHNQLKSVYGSTADFLDSLYNIDISKLSNTDRFNFKRLLRMVTEKFNYINDELEQTRKPIDVQEDI